MRDINTDLSVWCDCQLFSPHPSDKVFIDWAALSMGYLHSAQILMDMTQSTLSLATTKYSQICSERPPLETDKNSPKSQELSP